MIRVLFIKMSAFIFVKASKIKENQSCCYIQQADDFVNPLYMMDYNIRTQ